MITNKKYNVDLVSLADKKIMYEFGKGMHFDVKTQSNKSTRDRTLIKLLESADIIASGVSKTIFLSSDPEELCQKFKMIIQEKQARKNFEIINQGINAIIEKLLEYQCKTKKQHKKVLVKCNLLHEQV